jgi:hypothetical protein
VQDEIGTASDRNAPIGSRDFSDNLQQFPALMQGHAIQSVFNAVEGTFSSGDESSASYRVQDRINNLVSHFRIGCPEPAIAEEAAQLHPNVCSFRADVVQEFCYSGQKQPNVLRGNGGVIQTIQDTVLHFARKPVLGSEQQQLNVSSRPRQFVHN